MYLRGAQMSIMITDTWPLIEIIRADGAQENLPASTTVIYVFMNARTFKGVTKLVQAARPETRIVRGAERARAKASRA